MGNETSSPNGGPRRGCGSFGSWGSDDREELRGPRDASRDGAVAAGRPRGNSGAANGTNGDSNDTLGLPNGANGQASKRTARSRRGSAGARDDDGGKSNAALSAAERTVSEAKRRGSDAVIQVMQQYANDPHIQSKCLQALLQLCCHEQTTTAQHLSEIGAIELVILAMTTFDKHQAIQQDGVGLLWSLSANVQDEMRVRQAGGVKAVVNAMNTFQSSTVMQHRGCGALFNLSNTVSTRGQVASDGAITVILACFRNHINAVDVMQQANLSINPLADHDGNKTIIAEAGGISLIISSMRTHSGDEIVQRHGCGALHVLASLNAKNKVLVRESGGIPVVIACMQRHMSSPKLLQRACGVLWNVTCNNDANKLVVVSLNGIDALVEAMGQRLEHQGIQREACGALRNLSLLAANKPLIGRPPVIAAVLEAMRHHLMDADIQEQAAVLLYSVSDTPDTIHAILSAQGVEAVLEALKTHVKKPSVLEECYGLMYKLNKRAPYKILLEDDTIPPLQVQLWVHPLMTIQGIAQRVGFRAKIDVDALRIVYRTTDLGMKRTLRDCGIEPNSTLDAMMRIKDDRRDLNGGGTNGGDKSQSGSSVRIQDWFQISVNLPGSSDVDPNVARPPKRDPQKEVFALATKAIAMHPTHDGVRKYAQGVLNEWNNPSYANRFTPSQSGSATPNGGQSHRANGQLQQQQLQQQQQTRPSSNRNTLAPSDISITEYGTNDRREQRNSRRNSPPEGSYSTATR